MSSKTKTIKIRAVNPEKLEPLDVPVTKKIDVSTLNFGRSFEDELKTLSYSDCEYRYKFEETDPEKRALLKKRMKELKK